MKEGEPLSRTARQARSVCCLFGERDFRMVALMRGSSAPSRRPTLDAQREIGEALTGMFGKMARSAGVIIPALCNTTRYPPLP
ncbi:hypothetical protein ABGN05_20030 [Aquibium sp. LZ166]|uniref:Uncharacterized protein n=1 Tax=Aquibium pacificus TaxID=3153579 RepID=A0ABV3SME6_9HYPH